MKVAIFFFYLLLILLPTQLARHFFFDFSLISGLRSDYLAPTVYLTDILIILMGGAWTLGKIKDQRSLPRSPRFGEAGRQAGKIKNTNKKSKTYTSFLFLLFAFCYLIFNIIFVASNKWVALYKLVKIIEFIFLSLLIVKIKPKLSTVASCLSVGVFYSSIVAIWQFIVQRSIGGFLWYLGERTFYASTPGIAAFAFDGKLYLRPYATFPHPNVLAGFLAVTLPVILYWLIFFSHKSGLIKAWFIGNLILGLAALILTFSRGAWLVAFLGLLLVILEKAINLSRILQRQRNLLLMILYIFIIISIGFPLLINQGFVLENQSLRERADLVKIALKMLMSYPVFGLGLNSYLVQIKSFAPNISSLYLLQPVHNIYLLIISETGIIGFGVFIIGFISILNKSFKTYPIITISLLQLFLLGLFDHYLFTLQQGQLLLTLFASLALYHDGTRLAFSPRNK